MGTVLSLRYSASILGREVFSGEMIPRVLTHRLGVILKLQGVATIAPCNVRRVDIRTLITARPLWGPKADEKYKSQEEKAKEQQNKDKQKKNQNIRLGYSCWNCPRWSVRISKIQVQ